MIPASLVNASRGCGTLGRLQLYRKPLPPFFMEWCKTLLTMKKEIVVCPQFRGKCCMERYMGLMHPWDDTREDGTLPTGEARLVLFQVGG
jgi:hypothetical protein